MNDLHEGGAVMWIGGAAIMFAVIMVTFFSWTREPRPSAAMGWLESARRSTWPIGSPRRARRARERPGAGPARGQRAARTADVDDDDDQLAAYNAYLARINSPISHGREPPNSGRCDLDHT